MADSARESGIEDSSDLVTARAFANSWNNLPVGSIYTRAQFEDWLAPLSAADVSGARVLELGCGNASLLVHLAAWHPGQIVGVDLGDSVRTARRNLGIAGAKNWEVRQADLVNFNDGGFDLVFSIGVLHHLNNPDAGFDAMLRNVGPGGRFHGWVYAHEGNELVRAVVEPIRRVASRLPWWFAKYCIATPLVVPFFLYAKLLARLPATSAVRRLPLYPYSCWIAAREFSFFRHVAFDQIVTPRTRYLRRTTIDRWLSDPRVDPNSTYVIFRNGNSWKFGGRRTTAQAAS